MTECNQESFEFVPHFSRRVVAEFSADRLTTDGGVLLLRQVNHRLRLLSRFANCFRDGRDPARVEHSVAEMVAQRVYGLALGYEDVNDHAQLRHDPLLGLLAGQRDLEAPLAGKSTLNRMELSGLDPAHSRYHKIGYAEEAIDGLLVDLFLEAYAQAPPRIVLDLDSTDVPLHGHQERRFFHGYYDSYCYLPLYIFAGDHVLCARLRPADQDGAAGAVEEVRRIVAQIRQRWPEVQIVVRADSGFGREELMGWCEAQRVDYVLGLARNQRLRRRIGPEMWQARRQCGASGRPARVFTAFDYRTRKSWSRARRVVAKAEFIPGKENPRFVVTSPGGGRAASALRDALLRPRRDGKPHQGTDGFVRRPAQHRDPARQPTAPLLFGHGLYVAGGAAPPGAGGHRLGARASGHAPSAPAQDRRPGAPQRPSHLAALHRSLSLEAALRPRLDGAALLSPGCRPPQPFWNTPQGLTCRGPSPRHVPTTKIRGSEIRRPPLPHLQLPPTSAHSAKIPHKLPSLIPGEKCGLTQWSSRISLPTFCSSWHR